MLLPDDLAPIAEHIGLGRVGRVAAALDQRVGGVVCVMEAVRRRHNASAILRSCEAFGVHEVHFVTAGFRSSKGAARGSERWVDLHQQPTTGAALDELKGRGFRIYVADLSKDAWTPETVPVDQPLALLFGSEVRGVSTEARARADGTVCVPMHGLTESLNVSVSAAILLHAVAERRRALVGPDLPPERKAAFLRSWLEAEDKALRGFMARTRE